MKEDGTKSIDGWLLGGVAEVSDKRLHLTRGSQSEKGAIWTALPAYNAGANWQMDLDFHIYGDVGKLFGDGLALWYAKDASTIG